MASDFARAIQANRRVRDLLLANSLEQYIAYSQQWIQEYLDQGNALPEDWPEDPFAGQRRLIALLRGPYEFESENPSP